MTMHADMEILSEMLGGDASPFGEIIEQGQDNSYYNSFGITLLKQFPNKENYYNFLMGVVGDFETLSDTEKEMIQNKMGIFPKTIIQEKIVFREKKVKTISKPKLNIHDDY
jgi:hypothetical protein